MYHIYLLPPSPRPLSFCHASSLYLSPCKISSWLTSSARPSASVICRFFFFFFAARAFLCLEGIDDGFWSISWIYRSKSRASFASLSWLATITSVSQGPSWVSLVLPRHFSLFLRYQGLLICDDEVQQWPSTLDSPLKCFSYIFLFTVSHIHRFLPSSTSCCQISL